MAQNNLHSITKGLYLGDNQSAGQIRHLQSHGITHILICGAELEPQFPEYFIYKKLNMLDKSNYDLEKDFNEGILFINQVITSMNIILVYCNKGKSRSPTIVIGYLMKFHELKCEYAIDRVKKLHPTTAPIKAFVKFLQRFDQGISRDKCSSCNCLLF